MNIIFPQIKTAPILKTSNYTLPTFRGNSLQPEDSFTKTSPARYETIQNIGDTNYTTGIVIKNITLKDRENNPVSGFLMQDINYEDKYYIGANGKVQCKMEISKRDDCIFIVGLHGKNNNGEIKGAGTELLKYAVEKSKNLGHGGEIQLQVAGSHPFYFKNNFRFYKKRSKYANIQNAAIDYIARTGNKTEKLWNEYWSAPVATLTPANAEKLLSGERIMDKSKSKVLYSSTVAVDEKEKLEVDMDFCDFEDCFVLQMVDKNANSYAQVATLEGKIENGELIPDKEIKDGFYPVNENITKEFEKALKMASEIYKTRE